MGGVTMRPERALTGTFTRPVTRAGAVVLARPGAPPPAEKGIRLGVNAGGHLERLAGRLFPDATLVPTPDNRALPDLLATGRVDAVLTDEVEAEVIRVTVPDAVCSGPLTRDAKAYLGRDPALVEELDAWLRAREIDGTLPALRARWLGPARTAFASDLDALLALIDLRLAFMPVVAAAKMRSGRAVEDPAQEARVLESVAAAARARGLAVAPVEALFRAQLAAARDIQRRFLARPWPVEVMDLERDARPALARLSQAIVARAAALVGEPLRIDATSVLDALDASLASAPDRAAIAHAVAGLRAIGAQAKQRAAN